MFPVIPWEMLVLGARDGRSGGIFLMIIIYCCHIIVLMSIVYNHMLIRVDN